MIYNSDEEESKESTAQEPDAAEEEEEESILIGLCTDINEESMKEIALSLLTLNGGKLLPDKNDDEKLEDIEFFISSNGGSVNDMFAIYDLMELVKANRDIATFGYGRVASAAVVLLAGGTKGKRYISKNTRVMLHHCSSELGGSHPTIRSSFAELKKVEALMIEALAANSNLSVGEYYSIFSKNTDEYFSAAQVLEMGLVDKII